MSRARQSVSCMLAGLLIVSSLFAFSFMAMGLWLPSPIVAIATIFGFGIGIVWLWDELANILEPEVSSRQTERRRR